jgi:hypothetical protein
MKEGCLVEALSKTDLKDNSMRSLPSVWFGSGPLAPVMLRLC